MLQILDPPCSDLADAATLPRVDGPVAHALSHAYSRAAPIDVVLGGRTHRFAWRAVPDAVAPCDAFRFRLGEHDGFVAIDRVTVSALLGERHSERLPRELRCVLWADALHAVATAIEGATRLPLSWVPDAVDATFDPRRAVGFSVDADAVGGRSLGHVQFDDPAPLATWLPRWPEARSAPDPAFDTLRVPVSFVIGRAQVPVAQLRGVCRGDIVGIGDWGSAGAAVRITAQVGGPRGVLLTGLAEGHRITIQQTRDLAMNREPAAATDVPDADTRGAAAALPLDRLDALEVALRFEVGDLSLSLAELRSVRAGHIFQLPHALSHSPVRIVAHGRVLGQGHLVAVGDQLGVRVAEFAPGEL